MRVDRREFEDRFRDHRLSVDRLPSPVKQALAAHGVSEARLRRLAGRDHVLSGAELNRLYEALAVRQQSGRPVDLQVSRELFQALTAHAERVAAARAAAPTVGPTRRRSAGIGAPRGPARAAAPADPSAGPAPASEPPSPPARAVEPEASTEPPALPAAYTARERRIGRQRVATDTRVTDETRRTAAAIADLPPGEGTTPVRAYLDALGARDQRARLEAEGQRRAAAAIGRPEGVPARVWNMTAALQRRGISADDAAQYLATGTLPDLYGADGQVAQTGAERLQALHRAAVRDGSWTAVNSFTYLVSMRRSAMSAERGAATAHAETLPADDPHRAQIAAAVTQSEQDDRALRSDLNGIYRAATTARERTGAGLIRRADGLDRDAAAARAGGNEARASELETEAQRLRDRGARITHAEAQYRASIPSYRQESGRLYRLAASAQIGTGEAQIRAFAAAPRATPIPEAPPAVLGHDDGANTGNGIPGAARLLGTARTVDPSAATDDGQLALEGRRSAAVAGFHRTHLARGDYGARVTPGAPPPPERPASLVAHRRAYLGARVDEARTATARLDLARAEPATVQRDLRVADLERTRRAVADELAGTLGQSMASDRAARDDAGRVRQLETDLSDARAQLTDARAASGTSLEDVQRAIDADSAVFGDALKTSGEARRDDEGITDARTLAGIEDGRVRVGIARVRQTRGTLGRARAAANASEAQAARDRQDGALVRRAAARLPSEGPVPAPRTVEEAYGRARGLADRAARGERAALFAAAARAPAGAEGAPARLRVARQRIDLSRYYTRSAEADATALGDAGRRGATDRLDAAGTLADEADGARATLADGSPERVALASGLVTARTELATANGGYRPGVARDQLRAAEATVDADLLPHDRALAGQGYLQVGRSATTALARADGRFDEILEAGQNDPTAADDLYRQAHRMLDPAAPGARSDALVSGVNRGDLVPDGAPARSARALLGRFDRALETVDGMFAASGRQVQRGADYALAQGRRLGHAEIQAAQAQVSTVISGGAWVLSLGQFDMKDQMADAGESAMRHRLHWIRQDNDRMQAGMQDMAGAWRSAREDGRAFEFLNAVRVFSDRDRRATMPEAYTQAFLTIDGQMPQARRRRADWQHFNRIAIREGHVPIAAALRGPTLGFEPAMQALGDDRIMAVTPTMMDGIQSQADSLRETTDGMMWVIGLNTSLEVGLGLVLTAGVGSGAALAEGANAVNAVRTAGSAMNAARSATLAMRAMSMARTMGTVTLVGGGMMAANYGVGRLVGKNTGAARGFEVLTNFIPIGAGQRAAGIGRGAGALDDAAAATSRLARLRQAMSWSHVRELSAWGRAATPAALGGAQAFATTVATPYLAQQVGLERSELGQAAIGLGLNVIFAGGLSLGTSGRGAAARGLADHLVRAATPEGAPALPRAARRQVRAEVEAFLRDADGRVPTDAEVSGLKARLHERLGLVEGAPDVSARRQLVDGTVEALRIERAAALGLDRASSDPMRALDEGAARLFEARGGPEGPTSRLQAQRDVATVLSERLAHDAQAAYARGDATSGDRLMRQRAELGDRATAAELVEGAVRATPAEASSIRTPADRARVEGLLGAELTAARRRVDGDGAPLSRADYDRVAQRLVDEAGLSPREAATLVEGARAELAHQGLVRHLAAAQAEAGARPLSDGDVRAAAADLARRVGLSDPDGFASRVVERRAQYEAQGVLRPDPQAVPTDAGVIGRSAQQAGANDPGIRQFMDQHGEAARQLVGQAGEEGFRRAFMDGGHVDFDARRLLDLPPARRVELAQLARRDPAQVQAILRGLSGEAGSTVRRVAEEAGLGPAAALARIAHDHPQGVGYLRSLDGGEARLMTDLAADPSALRARARDLDARVFMRASDGTYLMRGEATEPTPLPPRAELEGLAQRAGVDPAVLADPTAHPAAMARLMRQMRAEMSPTARAALDTELQGRRFVDHAHFEEAHRAGVTNPEHRYGRRDFGAWQRAEGMMREAAQRGEPLTIDLLQRAHAAAAEGILPADRRGALRSAPADTVHQGGDGPMGIQSVSPAELATLRDNPHLQVHDLGPAEDGAHRVIVEYTAPEQVRSRLQAVLQRAEQRLAAGEDPVAVAADVQREVVSIHPFQDGNGRMSRLAMDYVLQRAGLEPSVVRDPNLDTQVSAGQWRTEVRDGLRTPFEATQRAWARSRAGEPPPASGSDVPVVPTGAPPRGQAALYQVRDTLGWSGAPTRSPAPGQDHLAVIQRGLDAVPAHFRRRVEGRLASFEGPPPALQQQREALGQRLQRVYDEHGALMARPDAQLSPAGRATKRAAEADVQRIQGQQATLERQIEGQQRGARAAAVQEMARLRDHLLGQRTSGEAARRAAAVTIEPSAARRASAEQLQGWMAEFFHVMPADIRPDRIQLRFTDKRAHTLPSGHLNVGERPTKKLMFHELGHHLEFHDAGLARAARAWVRARSADANGGTPSQRSLRDLTGSDLYDRHEVAFEDHFESPYVGKDYGSTPGSEVISRGMEYFTSPESMLQLYQRDPEHFFFMMGVLSP